MVPALTEPQFAEAALAAFGLPMSKEQAWARLDDLQVACEAMEQGKTKVAHVFTPGLYIRHFRAYAGQFIISKVHGTEHPFFALEGKVTVYTAEDGVITVEAPYVGITKPGTRRALLVHEDMWWITCHPTNKTTPEEVENDIIIPHPLLK